ncbi:unnamed protein product [Amoebophrya sp. A25]|nr:unnamed protein product [Amoebophrya sp. A25]|eukprot:GSA25T00007627001.1
MDSDTNIKKTQQRRNNVEETIPHITSRQSTEAFKKKIKKMPPSPGESPRAAQPLFSRRNAGPSVTDPNLVRRGLGGVIQSFDEQQTAAISKAKAILHDVPQDAGQDVGGDEERQRGGSHGAGSEQIGGSSSSTARSPDKQKMAESLVSGEQQDVLALDPKLAKKQIQKGFQGGDPNAEEAVALQVAEPDSAVGPDAYSADLVARGPHLSNYLDREFLESAISTYNRLAEHARNKQQYKIGIGHLRRALSLEQSGVVPPDDWPLKVLLAKTQVNVATLQYLLNQPHESLLEAALARDRSLECLNYLDSETFSARKGQEDPDLLFLLEESAVTFCLALHSAALAMKQLPGTDAAGILEVDRLAWKIGTKYLDRTHPCLSFLRKAFETRGTLTAEETLLEESPEAKEARLGKHAQQKAKKRMLVRELEDLQHVLRDGTEETDFGKVWDDILVVKQKAVNFELNLQSELHMLEAEFVRRRRAANAEVAAKGAGPAPKGGPPPPGLPIARQRALSAGARPKKKRIRKVADAPVHLEPAEIRRQREALKHERQHSRLITRLSDEQHLYEVRMAYASAKLPSNLAKRPQSAAPTVGGRAPAPEKEGHHRVKKTVGEVVALAQIMHQVHENIISQHPRGNEIAAELYPSLHRKNELETQFADGIGKMTKKQSLNKMRASRRNSNSSRLRRSRSLIRSPGQRSGSSPLLSPSMSPK